MYTLVQFSDLHRSEDSYISNDELVSSLLADCGRFSAETPQISYPDAIIVSGDLVQGLPLEAANYPNALEKQYNEALDLLTRLADVFVGGDHSKVIITPGNHDIDWNMARKSMSLVPQNGQNIPELLSLPDSPYRWSWKDMQLFLINNQAMYEDRLKYFCDLHNNFYKGTKLAFSLDPKRSWNLFELHDGRILVCAFNSCANNDCFCHFGEIHREAISHSHLALLPNRNNYSLKIAVWHHDVQGPPRRSDYMEMDSVKIMIDKGYRLGMHGHQHKSDISPYFLYTPEEHKMAVVSAGSLRASPNYLPTGFGWQYNIIEISNNYCQARVHVREMIIQGIFTRGRLAAHGSRSYADIDWTPPLSSSIVNTGRGGGPIIPKVEQIEELIKAGEFEDAILLIEAAGDKLSYYGRQLLSEALFQSKKWDRLAKHLSKPQNADELTKLVIATIETKNWTEGERVLRAAEESQEFTLMLIRDLRNRLNAKKGISP